MTELRVWDYGKGRPHIFAEYHCPDGADDQLDIATRAIDAISALGNGLFKPLAVDVSIAYIDDEHGLTCRQPEPASPFHQLRRASLPAGVGIREIWTDTRVAQCERLDPAGVLAWFRTIYQREEPQTGCRPEFTWLNISGVQARLPDALHDQRSQGGCPSEDPGLGAAERDLPDRP